LFVFVDQSAKDWFAAYSAVLGEVDDVGGWLRWLQAEGAVRASIVVVANILDQHAAQVEGAENLCDVLVFVQEAPAAVAPADAEGLEVDHVFG